MKIELKPYVESVNPENQIDNDLLEYKVLVLKQTDGFRISFKVEEFYHGRLSQGGRVLQHSSVTPICHWQTSP